MTYVIEVLSQLGLPTIRGAMRYGADVDWTSGVPTGLAVTWLTARGVWEGTPIGRVRVACYAERQSLSDDVARLAASYLGTAAYSVYRNPGLSPGGLTWPCTVVEVNAVGN